MKVSELIALLQKADPDAEVFDESEGSLNHLQPDDVRVGQVNLLRLIEASGERTEHYDRWYVSSGHPSDAVRTVRTCEGVLLGAGESDREWPTRLGSR